jgi:hypothetical protein
MDFTELDEAKKNSGGIHKRGSKQPAKKKPKIEGGSPSDNDDTTESTSTAAASLSLDLRTGRWTPEETTHCDALIHQFMMGRLPLSDGLKLNEFLAAMLKSKQSRLTKKMKNAKLSSKTFKRSIGFLAEDLEAIRFGESESAFFNSIQNGLERAEMKFHIGKEWREAFSTYCVSHGQSLNADKWLASVEEMDRRNLRVKEVERVRRREMMMGCALRRDTMNPDRGVVIDGVKSSCVENGNALTGGGAIAGGSAMNNDAHQDGMSHSTSQFDGNANAIMTTYQNGTLQDSFPSTTTANGTLQESQNTASPFLHKIIAFIQLHHVPFEYVDVWVPSFVPDEGTNSSNNDGSSKEEPKCRLCYAGSLIANQVILENNNRRQAVPLSPEDQFNLQSFGDYSESFSFDVGCGLPGRVYHMGVPTWEQSVHNAPLNHFERVGGAQQWGIRTVVGIPVPSPNVGRVVVVLYSRHDRVKDHDLVIRLTEEFTRLMPSPKWKLVVDVGEMQQVVPPQRQQQAQNGAGNGNDNNTLASEVISMFGEHMPSDPSNPGFAYLQGFMSLRLLLLRTTRSNQEQDIVNTILSSYSSYKAGGRSRPDMALMLARDFMFLNQQTQVVQVQNPQVMQMNGHVANVQQHQQQYLPMGNTSMHQGNMNAPAPVMAHHPQQQQQQQPPSSEHSVASYSSQVAQNQPSYTMPQDSYFMMSDIEPAPVNIPPQQNDHQGGSNNQSPLDAAAAVDNVESLLSPENTGSVGAYSS